MTRTKMMKEIIKVNMLNFECKLEVCNNYILFIIFTVIVMIITFPLLLCGWKWTFVNNCLYVDKKEKE